MTQIPDSKLSAVKHLRAVNHLRAVKHLASRGFTLVEIMIATAILTLGLVGILALFPVAIQAGRQVVEDSNAAVIARSVAESIRTGIRYKKRFTYRNGLPSTYFVFNHDGVKSAVPVADKDERPYHDYYILLPRFRRGALFTADRAGGRSARRVAVDSSKTFVYPETDDPPNGRGDALAADDDGDDFKLDVAGRDYTTFWVEQTYHLGNRLVHGVDDVEELSAAVGDYALADMKTETLKQYSYAFAIRPSAADADLGRGRADYSPANRLYSVTVMVFRSFPKNGFPQRGGAKRRDPVYTLEFEVSL